MKPLKILCVGLLVLFSWSATASPTAAYEPTETYICHSALFNKYYNVTCKKLGRKRPSFLHQF